MSETPSQAKQIRLITAEFPRLLQITDSQVIDFLAYDPTSRVLRVSFRGTASIWDYYKVWPSIFGQMAAAHSPGQVFNAKVRNVFQCQRIYPKAQQRTEAF